MQKDEQSIPSQGTAITVQKQLQTMRQKVEERLEEWAEHCQQCAYDAWGKISPEVTELTAVEAFLRGVLEIEAAFSVIKLCQIDWSTKSHQLLLKSHGFYRV